MHSKMWEIGTNGIGQIGVGLEPGFVLKCVEKEAGILTDADVLELLEVIKVKTTTFHTARGSLGRSGHSCDARWLNFVLGGCDSKGKDASNELPLLFVQAIKEMNTRITPSLSA